MSNKKWDKKFSDLSELVASWSKDTSRGVGSVIVDEDNRVLSVGYNGFPRGVDDTIESRYERPAKYLYTEHAERNAIFSAARNGVALKGSVIYSTLYPCADCARAIIQSGVTTVITNIVDENHDTWGESFKVSKELFEESGVEVIFMDKKERKLMVGDLVRHSGYVDTAIFIILANPLDQTDVLLNGVFEAEGHVENKWVDRNKISFIGRKD